MADIQGLIQHLRSQANPGSADAAALAARFGVDESLVHSAIQSLSRAAPRTEVKRRAAGAGFITGVLPWVERHPLLAMAVCAAVVFVGMFVSEAMSKPAVFVVLGLVLLGAAAALVVAALSRRARFGLLVGPIILAAVTVEMVVTDRGTTAGNTFIGLALMAIMLSTAGLLAAMLGGFIWLKRREKLDRNMSRQQMLDRLLQVRLELEYPRGTLHESRWRTLVLGARRMFWPLSLGAAVLMAAVQTVVFRTLVHSPELISGTIRPATLLTREQMFAVAILAVIGFGQFLIMVVIGYFGQKIWRSILASAIYLAVSFVPGLLGLNPLGLSRTQSLPPAQIVSSYAMFFICAAIGAGAAAFEEYAIRARMRQDNDPDALLAELLELEIALGGGLQESYVLVVDVAGSTAMKKGADPLVAEWTFRSYQELVARICGGHLGTVESTAGDGAVLAFPTANQALAASRELLGAIPDFNASTNRLGQDFVLRIGLHCGEVRGDLGQVQFTQVIDVAAHVEASSPRNGIGMTSVFRDKLDPVPDLERMAVSVDGFDVYVTG